MPDEIYADAELAALYDALNTDRDDQRFYLSLAGAGPAQVLDLGCGTGQFAAQAALAGHAVTGIDPAPGMLAVARRRDGGALVRWVEADARDLELGRHFDLIVMSGHVFQVFLTDDDVRGVLRSALQHLAPQGRLAFETRNPLVREWETWTSDTSREVVHVEPWGNVIVHYQLVSHEADLIAFDTHYEFADGRTRKGRSVLRFLAQQDVARHLTAAGFTTVRWFGDWSAVPFQPRSPEIIAVAER
ncbi:MAG: class I SAM-dependent methyltransferase [Proteobacteria bacterium]|nr:class I SAM-dependent methyltransferase [Pseudomonadota bacterium]